MSRVNEPNMIGNDFVSVPAKEIPVQKPAETTHKFAFPQMPQAEIEPPVQQFAFPEAEQDNTPPPYQHLGALAFNAPAIGQTPFALPSTNNYGSRFFTKAKITAIVIALAVIGLTFGAISEKQHIVALARDVKAAATQVTENAASHKTATPASNPRQLLIHSSDYDSAMTALMTQPITLNVGGSAQAVSAATIANWINVKNQGSLMLLSVNGAALSTYLNQAIKSSGQSSGVSTYPQSVYNQIANNLLKAKGVSVTIPSS